MKTVFNAGRVQKNKTTRKKNIVQIHKNAYLVTPVFIFFFNLQNKGLVMRCTAVSQTHNT